MISVKQILEEERRKTEEPVTAPVVTPEENVQQGAVPAGAIESRTNRYMGQLLANRENVQQGAPNQAEQVVYDNKPEGWNDEQYEAVRGLGYTDDQIAQMFSGPDPQNIVNGIFSSIFKNNTPEPRVPDEKTLKRQRAIAGVGDALSLVSQLAGSAMGARPRERKWEESATARLNANQKELYDKYLAESDRYNRGLVNAHMQDYLQGKQDWQQTRKNISDVLNQVTERKIKQAESEQKQAFDREKFEETKRNNESLREQREHSMKIAEQNARSLSAFRQSQINKNNAAKHGKKSSLSGKKADTTFYLNTEQGDTNATTDSFGRPIVEYNLSKDEIFSLAQEAKKDLEFMQRNGLILSQPDALGSGSWKYSPDDEIALAYVQEMYNKQYQEAKAGRSQFPQVAIPQPKWDERRDVWQDPLDTPPYEQQKIEEQDEWDNYLID